MPHFHIFYKIENFSLQAPLASTYSHKKYIKRESEDDDKEEIYYEKKLN